MALLRVECNRLMDAHIKRSTHFSNWRPSKPAEEIAQILPVRYERGIPFRSRQLADVKCWEQGDDEAILGC